MKSFYAPEFLGFPRYARMKYANLAAKSTGSTMNSHKIPDIITILAEKLSPIHIPYDQFSPSGPAGWWEISHIHPYFMYRISHDILVGGFKHFFIFYNMWDVILPIDELIFFKMVIAPPTSNFYILPIWYPMISHIPSTSQTRLGQIGGRPQVKQLSIAGPPPEKLPARCCTREIHRKCPWEIPIGYWENHGKLQETRKNVGKFSEPYHA